MLCLVLVKFRVKGIGWVVCHHVYDYMCTRHEKQFKPSSVWSVEVPTSGTRPVYDLTPFLPAFKPLNGQCHTHTHPHKRVRGKGSLNYVPFL